MACPSLRHLHKKPRRPLLTLRSSWENGASWTPSSKGKHVAIDRCLLIKSTHLALPALWLLQSECVQASCPQSGELWRWCSVENLILLTWSTQHSPLIPADICCRHGVQVNVEDTVAAVRRVSASVDSLRDRLRDGHSLYGSLIDLTLVDMMLTTNRHYDRLWRKCKH